MPRAFGRRHRRIAWTAGILLTIAASGGLLAWKIHRDNAPEVYTPGEASADITAVVAEGGALHSGGGTLHREEVSQRRSDPLRDPGKQLPAGAPPPRFTDVTAEAGLTAFRTFAGNRSSQLPEDMGGGVAWGDYNNDGFEDLFLVSAGGALDLPPAQRARSMLFRNRGDGTFEEDASIGELRILGMGAAWGDYNNDGWIDLAVTGYKELLLFRNANGRLVRETSFPAPAGFWTGASWGDYNNDGRLDLYVCGYVRYTFDRSKRGYLSQQFGLEVPYTLNPASFEPERNLLFRNDGGRFTEVAKQLAVDNPQGRSLSALWHDFNADGWVDLYVANDISENKFFLNERGQFRDSGHSAWIAEYRGSMGLAAGDFDRDGDDDLFISHWIAQQYALYQSLAADNRAAGRAAGLHFTDVAEMVGIGQPSLQKIGWGTAFADFDSDGWLDLAVANGSTFESKDAQRRLLPMESFLFWSNRGRFFHDLAPWNRSLSTARVSRGLAVADYDNDGSVDVAVIDLDGGVRLLRNDMPHGNWIEVRLARAGGLPADGSIVVARAGAGTMRAAVTSASYVSQNSPRVHFGLGSAARVDTLEVFWPGGRRDSWSKLDGNRIWDVRQGEAEASPFGAAALVQFWAKQRSAMDAMKRQGDTARATQLFREALSINPSHEDSRYYLANCLVTQGDIRGAVSELDELARINPMSHRAWQRRGVLLAATGRLAEAQESLERARRINPEETGTLLLLSEVALARNDPAAADRQLGLALQMNPRSAGGLFLRG
ncbi:MAG TPA: FG-GAP-like repeat-containing protein, partial [Bryobacteraceae bacterium]|nr:FG-GAP-like repeat-containing protein [Bryobacteraceae bacterium]